MVGVGLLVRLVAKPGKERELEHLLRSGQALVDAEPKTITWFAFQISSSTFGIFDSFPDEQGRQDHLAGPLAAALLSKAPELLAEAPVIEKVDLLAMKFPESGKKR